MGGRLAARGAGRRGKVALFGFRVRVGRVDLVQFLALEFAGKVEFSCGVFRLS
jgi:hypothetical protein